MPPSSEVEAIGRRYALCVGIGTYTKLTNRNLQYAVADAKAIADRLGDSHQGNFQVTLLVEPAQTTKIALEKALYEKLNNAGFNREDMVVIYISCHGDVYGNRDNFCLLPSDAELEEDGRLNTTTGIDIHDLTKALSNTRVKNIIFLLDICYSGGAGAVLQRLDYDLNPDTNLFIIGAARHDQATFQTSKLRHGIFTSHLLQAFEQKPTRSDGWLTISQIHSSVADGIKPLQIQASSASVNPNLLFIKNPHYSPESRDFYEMVKKLLELVPYEPVQTTIPPRAPAGFYVAETKAGLHTHRVGIIPYYNQVEPLTFRDAEKIALFVKEQMEQNSLNEGLVVTTLEVSPDIREIFRGARYLDVSTYESILKQHLIDFKRYLQKLADEYGTATDDPPLSEVYIPLNAQRRRYQSQADSNTAAVKAMKPADVSVKRDKATWEGDLEQKVKRWLSVTGPSATPLALLADYGSGKSTFCQHLAATLARDYFTTQEHERYHQRIPLLIPLRDFGRNPVNLKGYLVSYLKQYCHVDNPDAEALMKMAEAGSLLFILDGFDEMASRATNDIVAMNMEQFEPLIKMPQNKVLLTARTEYFLNLRQEQQALQAYACLYLQPFDEGRVDLYLKKRVPFLKQGKDEPKKDWKYYRQKIDEIHDLSDLSSRPVFLEMIVKTLPALVAEGKAVNRPNLYQHYLEGELDRQIRKQRRDLLIKRERRFEIMERIALELYRTGKVELTSKQILAISKELLTLEQQEEMEGSLREIVTCSFLIRTGNEYRFSHQTFLEYLVAHRLAGDIKHHRQENFRLKPITRIIEDFLRELEVDAIRRSSIATNADNLSVSFDKETVVSWFRDNPKDKWMSSNAVSLLARLLPHDQLCKLSLRRADLSNADLQDADLQDADLQDADLQDANLQDANLRGANLRGADLRGANLRGANLRGAILQEIDLRGADLRGAILQEIDLQEVDLRGVDLRGADLRKETLEGTNRHKVSDFYHKQSTDWYDTFIRKPGGYDDTEIDPDVW